MGKELTAEGGGFTHRWNQVPTTETGQRGSTVSIRRWDQIKYNLPLISRLHVNWYRQIRLEILIHKSKTDVGWWAGHWDQYWGNVNLAILNNNVMLQRCGISLEKKLLMWEIMDFERMGCRIHIQESFCRWGWKNALAECTQKQNRWTECLIESGRTIQNHCLRRWCKMVVAFHC